MDLRDLMPEGFPTPFLCPACGNVLWVALDGDDAWTECVDGDLCPTANAGRDAEVQRVHEAATAWGRNPQFPVPHPTGNDVCIVGRDGVGFIATSPDLSFRWYLTDCCLASAKGSMGAVVCRGCYVEIDEALGGVPA